MFQIPHIEMILAAYTVAAAVIGAMVALVWLDYRSLIAAIEALESKDREPERGAQ